MAYGALHKLSGGNSEWVTPATGEFRGKFMAALQQAQDQAWLPRDRLPATGAAALLGPPRQPYTAQ